MSRSSSIAALLAVLPVLLPLTAWAAETVKLELRDHRFTPAEIRVPAGERFRIEVTNADPTPAEFESRELRVEKIIAPGSTIGVMAGPLKPGTYRFVDDYHPDVAAGSVIAHEKE